MSIVDYINPLLNYFTDSRVTKKAMLFITKLIEKKQMNCWRISTDRNEYDRNRGLLNGSLKNTLKSENMNEVLLNKASENLKNKNTIVVIHDPSDIRKQYTKQSENLGKVLSLKKEVINGYSSVNSICIDTKSKKIHFLGCHPYSNKDINYVKEDVLTRENIDLLEPEFNLKSMMQKILKDISNKFKQKKSDMNIVHVLDRGFDDYEMYQYIDEDLKDFFVVRADSNRNSNIKSEDGKFIKLRDKSLSNNFTVHISKTQIKNKIYQNLTVNYGYEKILIEGCQYYYVRIELKDRNSKPIFENPMMLFTNIPITQNDIAEIVYHYYLKRSKIEGVFKFLKEALGWEDFRVKDFESIKNIISLCFFIGQYFYEIESELINDSTVKEICLLGGGKGKVTRHYFLEGLASLANYHIVQTYIEENNISKEQVDKMRAYVSNVS